MTSAECDAAKTDPDYGKSRSQLAAEERAGEQQAEAEALLAEIAKFATRALSVCRELAAVHDIHDEAFDALPGPHPDDIETWCIELGAEEKP